jgi:hypothetical protein
MHHERGDTALEITVFDLPGEEDFVVTWRWPYVDYVFASLKESLVDEVLETSEGEGT